MCVLSILLAVLSAWFPQDNRRVDVDHGTDPIPAAVFCPAAAGSVLIEGKPFEILIRSSTPPPVYFWVDLKVTDADGREFSYRPKVVESGEGGKVMTFDIPDEGRKPRLVKGLSCPCDENVRRGWFEIVRVSEPAPVAAEYCRIDVLTGTPYHCTTMPATNLVLTLSNPTQREMHWKGVLYLRDFFGVVREVPVDLTAKGGETLSRPLDAPDRMGYWRVEGSLEANGVHVRPRTAFAILDPHVRTPKVPRGSFRFGMNYHVTRYDERLRRDTMAAMNAIGVKLMRGDFAALIQMQPNGPDEWNSYGMDRMLAELEEHGIAVDAIIATTPGWARDEKHRKIRGGPDWVCPAAPGVYEKFGERLARHYGTRIDYYEIGNELDIVPASHLTVDEAMARQRECYRGIRRGCPDACVIPCGWTFGDSNHPMVSQKGFQERFMKEAHDVCDVHPLHLHGRYVDFVNGVNACFKWRKAAGIELPWYANETACSSCWGQEDLTTVLVWQKILWAWAHGSVDYIWYNLRSVGDDPMNGEHTYGVFLRDLHPRAPAASYSACAYVFGGATFDRILRDSENCQFYRFRRGDEIILAGWDRTAGKARGVRVATDAGKATAVDLMGNRSVVEVRDGEAVFPLGAVPSALVFKGASFADVNADDLARENAVELPRADRFTLNRRDQMKSLWEANADTEHRIWKGPDDLSAEIRLSRSGGRVKVVARVVDDRRACGDCLEVEAGGSKTVCEARSVDGTTADYEIEVPPGDSVFEIRVLDDDGEGLDGWMSTGKFRLP